MRVIRFNGQTPTPDTFKLCNLGDNKWEKIEFHIPRYAGMNATLHLTIGDYSDVVNLSSDGVYTVQRKHTQQAGTIRGYITIVGDEDIVWHSDEFKMIVGDVRDDGPAIEDAYPSAFEDALKALAEIKTAQEDVAKTAADVASNAKEAQDASQVAQTAAQDAGKSQQAAKEAADAASATLSDVQGIKTSVDELAAESRSNAERAKQSADNAAASAQSSADAAQSAQQSGAQATLAASDAAQFATSAIDAAQRSAVNADQSRSNAEQAKASADAAARSEAQAKQYEADARKAAEQAIGGSRDHRNLTNRDAPDQHPIGAITGLTSRLTDVDSRPMTSAEILAIMK